MARHRGQVIAVALAAAAIAVMTMPLARLSGMFYVQTVALAIGVTALAFAQLVGVVIIVLSTLTVRPWIVMVCVTSGPLVAALVQFALVCASDVDMYGALWDNRPMLGTWAIMIAGNLAGAATSAASIACAWCIHLSMQS